MTATAREQNSVVQLLETLKKTVPFKSGLVLTTVPRGGLQIAQPANAPEDLLKSYAKGFHASDKMSWQAILKHKPVRPLDACGWKLWFLRHTGEIGESIVRGHAGGRFDRVGSPQMALFAGRRRLCDLSRS